jgi:two-component system, OmpR family, phosphate regulon sensor histidine kinase PhoR
VIKFILKLYQNSFTTLRVWLRWGFSKRGFWTRAFLCFFFSLVILKFDEIDTYDLRFKLRGPQKINDSIVLVTIKPSDFVKIYDLKTNSLINVNESNEITDSFFWDQTLWRDVLQKILKQNPRSVGVTLFFGDNIGQTRLNTQDLLTFKDERILWATNSRELEKLSLPFATRPDRSNISHIDLLRDDDGVVRRLLMNPNYLPNISERSIGKKTSRLRSLPVINYRNTDQIPKVDLQSILNNQISNEIFKDKIVFIGIEKTLNSQILTPLGLIPRHAFWATIADNYIENRFIQKMPTTVYVAALLLLMILSVFIITHYTQVIALFLFLSLATAWTVFSMWTFDTFYIWIPIASPLALFVLIWIVYIGYQALRIEQAHNKLQQEQRYISELEQLKNNFVSLISHDLKTPIAKIQAVLDRLVLQNNLPAETQNDFINLKSYSDELNRYIQSILKVLRVESKDFKINKETADINGVIENVIHRTAPLAKSKSITISLKLEPMFLIEFDVTLMTEVMLNLVENAIKYTAENGQISIHTTETDTEVLVSVSDTGEGIATSDQTHIWKKFVRGKNQDLKTKGSGLGLYLVKYFIELHGGRITLKSELGKGTTFDVSLPIESEP